MQDPEVGLALIPDQESMVKIVFHQTPRLWVYPRIDLAGGIAKVLNIAMKKTYKTSRPPDLVPQVHGVILATHVGGVKPNRPKLSQSASSPLRQAEAHAS